MSREHASAPVVNGGIGFTSLLAILFIALKLTGYVGWSWIWVLAPIWIPIAIFIGLIVGLIIAVIVQSERDFRQAERRKAAGVTPLKRS